MNQVVLIVLIAAGGAVGSVLRYGVAVLSKQVVGHAFPLGTLLVNVVGCVLIGYLSVALSSSGWVREEYRAGLLVGLLGGLTTYSTFGFETVNMLAARHFVAAGMNIMLSLVLGLAAVAVGMRLAGKWPGVS
jgi:CrcB protein